MLIILDAFDFKDNFWKMLSVKTYVKYVIIKHGSATTMNLQEATSKTV